MYAPVDSSHSEQIMDTSFPPEEVFAKALRKALSRGGDFADVYSETSANSRIVLSEGIVKDISSSSDRGTGIRVLFGDATGYSFAETFDEGAVLDAAGMAASLASEGGGGGRVEPPGPLREKPRPVIETPPSEVPLETKVALVRRMDEAARAASPAVRNVHVVFIESSQEWALANAEGVRARDGRRLVNIAVYATAVKDGVRRQGFKSFAGPLDFGEIEREGEALGREAAEMAVRMLSARPAPSGKMPVVLCNGIGGGGVLFHESCGHALESDVIVQGQSIFAGKLGRKIASPLVSLTDDGTLERLSGGFRFDDEGTPAQKTPLIVEGVLVGYMCDRKGAKTLGLNPTGSGRRQSFRYPPIPRMRCTYLSPGREKPEDLVKAVDRGVYIARIGGGAGEMSGAGFVFSAVESYLIENGKIGEPVTGVTISGRGVDLLEGVDGVADDFEFNRGGGMCGKQGQMAFVTEGQPSIRIRSLTVGGDRHEK